MRSQIAEMLAYEKGAVVVVGKADSGRAETTVQKHCPAQPSASFSASLPIRPGLLASICFAACFKENIYFVGGFARRPPPLAALLTVLCRAQKLAPKDLFAVKSSA
jgi:hypothetical protein